jgi:hypothetical protein
METKQYEEVRITTRQTRQGWEFTEIRKYEYGMFRVYLERDFYPDQCEAYISKWSDEKGWVIFQSLDARKQAFMAVHPSIKENELTLAPFHETASVLWGVAEEFFGTSK